MIEASIIITTYKRGDSFLLKAVNSVLNQKTIYSFEVIVIDDNGLHTDLQKQTLRSLHEYLLDNKIVYIPLEHNSGACCARNVGIRKAGGEFIFFLDDDDTFLPNKIQMQIDYLKENYGMDGCLSAFERIGYKGESIDSLSNYPVVGDFVNFAIRGNFFTPMLCIKKDSIMKIGGFQNIPRFQDRFFMFHCLQANLQFGVINQPLYTLYEHEGDSRITNIALHKTEAAYKQIDSYIVSYKMSFSFAEWKTYRNNYFKGLGTAHYVSSSYWQNLKGIFYWIKAKDYRMSIKSIFKILRSK